MKSLITVFVLVVFFKLSDQCTCLRGTVTVSREKVPRTLCYNKTYVVAKIESKHKIPGKSGYDDIDGTMHFDAHMSTMIRHGYEDFPEGGKTISLFAPIGSSLCGYIDFELGKTYYVSVYEDRDKKLHFSGCSFARTKDEVTYVQYLLMVGYLQCPEEDVPPRK